MQEKSLVDQWLVIYRRKWQVLTVIFASVSTAVSMSWLIPPVYEASAVFYPPHHSPEATYLSPDSAANTARSILIPAPFDEGLAPYIGILKSKLIAERVAAEYPAVRSGKLLSSNMDFKVTNEYMLRLYSRANEPQLAADVANAYFRHLNLILDEASLKQFKSDEIMLRGQLDRVIRLIDAKKEELVTFELENSLANLAEAIASRYATHTQLISVLDAARVRLQVVESNVVANEREFSREEDSLLESTGIVSTPLVNHLRIQLGEVAEKLAITSIELGPLHEDVVALKTRRKEITRLLDDALKSVIGGKVKPGAGFSESLRQNLVSALIERDATQGQIKALESALIASRDELARFPQIKAQWRGLMDEIAVQSAVAVQLRKDLSEMELQEARSIEHLVLVDSATPPSRPAFPFMPINIFVSLLVGVLGGLFYAFLVDYASREMTKSARQLALEIRRGVRARND